MSERISRMTTTSKRLFISIYVDRYAVVVLFLDRTISISRRISGYVAARPSRTATSRTAYRCFSVIGIPRCRRSGRVSKRAARMTGTSKRLVRSVYVDRYAMVVYFFNSTSRIGRRISGYSAT